MVEPNSFVVELLLNIRLLALSSNNQPSLLYPLGCTVECGMLKMQAKIELFSCTDGEFMSKRAQTQSDFFQVRWGFRVLTKMHYECSGTNKIYLVTFLLLQSCLQREWCTIELSWIIFCWQCNPYAAFICSCKTVHLLIRSMSSLLSSFCS